jgi:hypothetical protein
MLQREKTSITTANDAWQKHGRKILRNKGIYGYIVEQHLAPGDDVRAAFNREILRLAADAPLPRR